MILAALVASGKEVLVPFGGHLPYDLAYEEDRKLVRVQCKSGRERHGVIVFRTHCVGRGLARDYRGVVDVFGVYCHDRGEVYMVPVEDVPPRGAYLRLDPPKNGQQARIRLASPYLLTDHIPKLAE